MANKNKIYRTPLWISILTIALALAVIVGWKLNVQVLMTIVPGYVSMKLNTALLFILSGMVVLFLSLKRTDRFIFFISGFLAVFALASLSQDIFNIDLKIDQLFIIDYAAQAKNESFPGRPSPITSLCFSLFGLVFLIMRNQNLYLRKIAQYGLHMITFFSFIAIVGYLFNVPTFYKLSFFTSMAIHTSVTLFALSIGASFFNRELGVTGLFTGKSIGNVMAKNLFKKILPAILILGFIQLVLLRWGFVTVEFGIALFTTCFMLVALYALWSTAILLNGIDEKRKRAESKIIFANKNLEKTVLDRTAYLTRQNKQLEDFSYIISHNLRGPMSNLKSLLGFHKEEDTVSGKDQLMDYFETTVTNLASTLDELLEVVTIRHESKKEREILNFEDIFSKIMANYQGQIMEFNARVTCDFSEAPTVEYSGVYLESIMQNLLSNALKYRSKNRLPEIHFKTRNVGNKIELSAIDNGLGIDMEVHGNRIFGLHKTFHKHPDAKGVGLFITKAQVEAMGGEISVQSEVDKGATFEIIF